MIAKQEGRWKDRMKDTGSTRKQIMMMLKTEGALTVSEIAERLGVTEMAVRRHINTLERDRLIESRLLRQSMGRPTNQYFLTEKSEQFFPKQYADFTMEILSDLEKNHGPEIIEEVFRNRAQRILNRHLPKFKGKNLEEKIRLLADLQDKRGYMVKWEKQADGTFQFIEYNCPISMVAGEYRQACKCEVNWFGELLGAEVERIECKTDNGQNCVYIIREKENG